MDARRCASANSETGHATRDDQRRRGRTLRPRTPVERAFTRYPNGLIPNGASRIRRDGAEPRAGGGICVGFGRTPQARRQSSRRSPVTRTRRRPSCSTPSPSAATDSTTSTSTTRAACKLSASATHANPLFRAVRISASTRSNGRSVPVKGVAPSSPSGRASIVEAISGSQPADASRIERDTRMTATPSTSAIRASMP